MIKMLNKIIRCNENKCYSDNEKPEKNQPEIWDMNVALLENIYIKNEENKQNYKKDTDAVQRISLEDRMSHNNKGNRWKRSAENAVRNASPTVALLLEFHLP